jgi:23S rRNA (cytosine1962-C5)-methyltransferase
VGVLAGDEPPEHVVIKENGAEFLCDIKGGQKTGFFLDQRENRLFVEVFCQGAEVLNCFSYSGGFSVFAARGGARSVESVDASEPALVLARENLVRNGFDSESFPCIRAQVFDHLKACRSDGRFFDVVIVDPPAFAKSRGALKRAQRAYVRLNEMAMQILKPGGILVSTSCSSAVDYDLFWDLIKKAGAQAGRRVQVVKTHLQSIDHPGYIAFTEGRYLKCFFCRVV